MTPTRTTDPRLSSLSPQRMTPEARGPAADAIRRKKNLTIAYWLSGILAGLATLASAVGVFWPSVFRDPAMTAGNARGTDLVILVVAIPAMVISMALVARGSLRARIVWLGALSYILYNAIFFAFDVVFNSLFLVYVAVLSLALWSLVTLLMTVDARQLRAHFTRDLPIRTIALYLIISTALFALVWLRDIVPALLSNTIPSSLQGTMMPTNPIHVVDLSTGFPLTILAAIWLWQRRPWGYVLSGLFLVYGVIEAISIATDQLFGHLHDPAQSVAMSPVFAVVAVIALIPTALYFRSLRRDGRVSDRSASASWPSR